MAYTFDYGLKILWSMGLNDFSEKEITTFEDYWDKDVKKDDLIKLTRLLYTNITSTVNSTGNSIPIKRLRELDFDTVRVDRGAYLDKLIEDETLKLKEIPEGFFIDPSQGEMKTYNDPYTQHVEEKLSPFSKFSD